MIPLRTGQFLDRECRREVMGAGRGEIDLGPTIYLDLPDLVP